MRVPLSWLREFVEFDFTPEQLAERLTQLGMEVKKIERWGADWRNVVVGELLAVEKHPRADRLSLTRVTIDRASPRFGLTSTSRTTSPYRSVRAMPSGAVPGRIRIPSPSDVRLSSSPEHSIPFETTPIFSVRSMRRSPGSTAPGSATGTR